MVTLRGAEKWIFNFTNVEKPVGNVENLCVHKVFMFPLR